VPGSSYALAPDEGVTDSRVPRNSRELEPASIIPGHLRGHSPTP